MLSLEDNPSEVFQRFTFTSERTYSENDTPEENLKVVLELIQNQIRGSKGKWKIDLILASEDAGRPKRATAAQTLIDDQEELDESDDDDFTCSEETDSESETDVEAEPETLDDLFSFNPFMLQSFDTNNLLPMSTDLLPILPYTQPLSYNPPQMTFPLNSQDLNSSFLIPPYPIYQDCTLDPEPEPTESSKIVRWTDEEDTMLHNAVSQHGSDWMHIQKTYFPSRTKHAVRSRYRMLLETAQCGTWTPEEDEALRKSVDKHGTNWVKVAQDLKFFLPGTSGRTPHQCNYRWNKVLKPFLRKGKWSKEEDDIILAAHEVHGTQWTKISECLPGRTDRQIRSRFICLTEGDKKRTGRPRGRPKKSS